MCKNYMAFCICPPGARAKMPSNSCACPKQPVVKVQQAARIGIAGKVKARGGDDAGTSLTTSNAEIARNTYAPQTRPIALLPRAVRLAQSGAVTYKN